MDYGTEDSYTAKFGASENEMQAAGRQASHEFQDFRSARRAYQRSKNYGRRACSRCHCWCCKRNHIRVLKAKDCSKILEQRPWDDDFGAQMDWETDMEFMNETTHMATFGNISNKARRLMAEEGEDFGTWGRRRIEEMRRVKEDRIRKQLSNSTPGPRSSSSVLTTTLPTHPLDIHGHKILREVLTPTKNMANWLRSQGKPPFHTIIGFEWFGEYSWAWAWHRNESGFWEIGYPGCGDGTFPCSCCGTGFRSCHCEEFEGSAAPDEMQWCPLVEWTRGSLRDMLEEAYDKGNHEDKDMHLAYEEESEVWEVMSGVASMEWSVLASDEEFEFV